jgi:glycosyltransferase involved in cell wall biosynthesis
MSRSRRLLLVTHRPIGYGGGGSVRWRFLRDALPAHGWEVEVVSAPEGVTTNEFSTDPRRARLASARAAVMGRVGALMRPVYRRALGIEPEAFPPSIAWSFVGRRAVRDAVVRVRPDVVWATGPPASALFAAAAVAPVEGLPLVSELRDLWAGSPYYDAGGKILPRVEARALRPADAVVCVTDEARERLASMHPELSGRLHVLPNGFDPQLLAMRGTRSAPEATGDPLEAVVAGGGEPGGAAGSPERPLTIIHAGALYGGRSVDALLDGLGRTELAGRARLELLGAAGGVEPGTRNGIEVAVTPPVPWDEAIARTRAADIVLVIFTPGDATAVPGKLYEALALGRPILALTTEDSATERLLRRLGQDAGVALHDDPEAIAAAVRRLTEAPPAPVPPERLERWDRARVAQRAAELLDGLVR